MSKVWFVTGASSGIGAALAKAVLEAGHRVVATARNMEKLRQALGTASDDRLALVQLDVTDERQAANAVEAAVAKFGRIDVVVNNAGYSLLGNFEEFTREQIERLFATNFFGATYVLRAALPILRRQRSGHVFNVSSAAGVLGFKHCSAYSATKFAMEGLSLSLAEEVAPFGIKVTLVEPGFFRTDLLAPQAAAWSENHVADYGPAGTAKTTWAPYDGKQTGDPAKLARALITIAGMDAPPKQFPAGSDVLAMFTQATEARLKELQAHAALSTSTDGAF